MPSRLERIAGKRRRGVAPHDLIREDFELLCSTVCLRAARMVEEAILMQSVEGHAHEGHGAFRRHRHANTTMDDIVQSLGRNPTLIARHRQTLIDEIADWARRAIAGDASNLLVTPDGECLLDIGLFRQIEVDPAGVLRGLYVGGLRDDTDVRRRAEDKYGIAIGGGDAYLVDVERMERMGLNARQLAKGEHEDKIADYREQGLIIADEGERDHSRELRYLYIRHRTGGGASDDAAMLAAGKLYGPSGAMGTFLADAIDTLEKYASRCADQDGEIARMIADTWPELGVGEDDLLLVTYLCAVPPDAEIDVPDCSLRYLLEIDRNTDQTAFESHLAYVQDRPRARVKVGSEGADSEEFYQWFEQRLRATED